MRLVPDGPEFNEVVCWQDRLQSALEVFVAESVEVTCVHERQLLEIEVLVVLCYRGFFLL